ncbi:unnamed protein product [Hermetia illucens]|uniref:Uncharacterized protein n=1 Tax=Hermetia illucens TaxID=343691 RepID=A0A7R8UYZ3_HERIL|nr:unnamed protein product [Hermetia illucens]
MIAIVVSKPSSRTTTRSEDCNGDDSAECKEQNSVETQTFVDPVSIGESLFDRIGTIVVPGIVDVALDHMEKGVKHGVRKVNKKRKNRKGRKTGRKTKRKWRKIIKRRH